MILLDLKGRQRKVSFHKYLVKWEEVRGSNAQFNTKQFFKNYWIHDTVCEEFIIPGSRLRLDLINFTKKIAIETSGAQHEKFNKFFHKNRIGFIKSVKRDFQKIEWLENNGISLIEIYDSEVKNLSKDFLQDKFNLFL